MERDNGMGASAERQGRARQVHPIQFGVRTQTQRDHLVEGLLGYGFSTVALAVRTLAVLVVDDDAFGAAFRSALSRAPAAVLLGLDPGEDLDEEPEEEIAHEDGAAHPDSAAKTRAR